MQLMFFLLFSCYICHTQGHCLLENCTWTSNRWI